MLLCRGLRVSGLGLFLFLCTSHGARAHIFEHYTVYSIPGDTIIIPEAVKVNRNNDVSLPLITRQFTIGTLNQGTNKGCL